MMGVDWMDELASCGVKCDCNASTVGLNIALPFEGPIAINRFIGLKSWWGGGEPLALLEYNNPQTACLSAASRAGR